MCFLKVNLLATHFCKICGYYDCFSTKAAKQRIILWKKICSVAPHWETWLRMHYWGIEREEKIPAPGGNRTHDLKNFARQECALPLCCDCPSLEIFGSIFIITMSSEIMSTRSLSIGEMSPRHFNDEKDARLWWLVHSVYLLVLVKRPLFRLKSLQVNFLLCLLSASKSWRDVAMNFFSLNFTRWRFDGEKLKVHNSTTSSAFL